MSGRKPRRGNSRPNPNRGRPNYGSQAQPRPPAFKKDDLQFLPSISRSGGDNGLGDTLKDESVQERYWKMIQDKLSAHRKEFSKSSPDSILRLERESNLLLHLRKLREGVLASQRSDEFALTVYETSFYLALVFRSPLQASTSLSKLPELYAALLSRKQPTYSVASIRSRAEILAIISLVFHLDEVFPSQGTYFRHVRSLEPLHLDWTNAALEWMSSLRASAACRNYAKCELLTRRPRLLALLENRSDLTGDEKHIVEDALCVAVGGLRTKVRNLAWAVLRFSYREFSISTDTDAPTTWLSRSLMLDSIGTDDDIKTEEWIKEKVQEGQLTAKEGSAGRWTIVR